MRNVDYLYKKEYYKDEFEKTYFCDKTLEYKKYENAIVLPYKKSEKGAKIGGGVVTSEGDYLLSSGLHNGTNSAYEVESPKISEETVIYLGMFVGIWGHHITDHLRRLWFLETEEYKQKYADYKIVYVSYPGFSFRGNYKEILDIMGFDCTKFVLVTEPTRFESVIIPDESFFTYDGDARYFTKEYRALIHRVRDYGIQHKTPIDFDKAYYTHAKIATIAEIGEYKLEKFFQEQGYKVIAPEELSFREQLNILVQCKSFAATIGSASHNIMFMKDGAEVILIPRSNYLTGYQVAIDEVTDLDIHYIDSSMSVLTDGEAPWRGPFYFYVGQELARFFDEIVDLSVRKRDYKEFKRYVRIGRMLRDDLSQVNAVDYYGKALFIFLEECRSRSLINKIPQVRKYISKIVKGVIVRIS